MSEDRKYYLSVPRSAEYPYGYKKAPKDLVDAAIAFEENRSKLRANIRKMEEKLVALNTEAQSSPSSNVFYDSRGFIYDIRHFVATGDTEAI